MYTAEQWNTRAQPSDGALTNEAPTGAIVNGAAFLDRVETLYEFRDHLGHPLANCSDWQEARRCFEHLAEQAMRAPAHDVEVVEQGAQFAEPTNHASASVKDYIRVTNRVELEVAPGPLPKWLNIGKSVTIMVNERAPEGWSQLGQAQHDAAKWESLYRNEHSNCTRLLDTITGLRARAPASTVQSEREAFEKAFVIQEGLYFSDQHGEYRSINGRAIEQTDAMDANLRLQGWNAYRDQLKVLNL